MAILGNVFYCLVRYNPLIVLLIKLKIIKTFDNFYLPYLQKLEALHRAVDPDLKLQTHHTILPKLFTAISFLYMALFLGNRLKLIASPLEHAILFDWVVISGFPYYLNLFAAFFLLQAAYVARGIYLKNNGVSCLRLQEIFLTAQVKVKKPKKKVKGIKKSQVAPVEEEKEEEEKEGEKEDAHEVGTVNPEHQDTTLQEPSNVPRIVWLASDAFHIGSKPNLTAPYFIYSSDYGFKDTPKVAKEKSTGGKWRRLERHHLNGIAVAIANQLSLLTFLLYAVFIFAYLCSLAAYELTTKLGWLQFATGAGNFFVFTARIDLFMNAQILSASCGIILILAIFLEIRHSSEYLSRQLAHQQAFNSVVLMSLLKETNSTLIALYDYNSLYGPLEYGFVLVNLPLNAALIMLLLMRDQLLSRRYFATFIIIVAVVQFVIVFGVTLFYAVIGNRFHKPVKKVISLSVIDLAKWNEGSMLGGSGSGSRSGSGSGSVSGEGKAPGGGQWSSTVQLHYRLKMHRYIEQFSTGKKFTVNYGRFGGSVNYKACWKNFFFYMKFLAIFYKLLRK